MSSWNLKATQSALSIRGICGDELAAPFHHFLEQQRKRVAQFLDGMMSRTSASRNDVQLRLHEAS